VTLKFILASANQHKAEEFEILFNKMEKKVISVTAASEKIAVVENGNTYVENALKKATAYFKRYKQPVLADDSGLNVEALPNDLGVHSANFGGDGLKDFERTELLLKRMGELPDLKRNAFFSCHLCFYFNESEVYFFEGRVKGRIGHAPMGNHGFGYDPVFLPEGLEFKKSLAEDPVWKDQHSHRAVAAKMAEEFFRGRCQMEKVSL